MARHRDTEAVSETPVAETVTLTLADLDAIIAKKIAEATGRRSDGQEVETPLPSHRCDHGHGTLASVLLAIAAHAGLVHVHGGSSPFDVAFDKLCDGE